MGYAKIDDGMRLKILRSKPIFIDEAITLKQYTINQILDDEKLSKYNSYVAMIINSPYDNRVALYSSNMIYSDISHWNMFLSFLFSEETREDIMNGMRLLFDMDLEDMLVNRRGDLIELVCPITGYVFDEFKFINCISIYREIQGLQSDEPSFANKSAIMYELKREVRRQKKKRNISNVTLNSMIEGLAFGNSNLTLDEVFGLTMYQLNRAIYRIDKSKKYSSVMTGIYTGNVKADDVNFSKVSWFSK